MKFPFQLLILELTELRIGLTYANSYNQATYCRGLIVGYSHALCLSYSESKRLDLLLDNCLENLEKPFPCSANAGPQLPSWMILE